MIGDEAQLAVLRLAPGELLVCREPCQVVTVLGSCLSITMFSPRFTLAAICHAMLPVPGRFNEVGEKAGQRQFKYVSVAVPAMLHAFTQAGVCPAELEVKMFGGANVLGNSAPGSRHGVGDANIHVARRVLQQEGLTLKASNVGGKLGRKIVFNTFTGKVLHKHLT